MKSRLMLLLAALLTIAISQSAGPERDYVANFQPSKGGSPNKMMNQTDFQNKNNPSNNYGVSDA